MIVEMLQEKNLKEIIKSSQEDVFRPFPLYGEREAWNNLPSETKEHFENAAQKLKDKVYPVLPATVYINFAKNGDRHSYESIYFPRRADLMTLVIAECVSGKKEYISNIIDLVWAICEETSWVPSAHNNKGELPDIEHETYIDLFAAETASAMAWTYYFLGDAIAETAPTVKRRIEFEVERRILTPYMKYNHFWYMGFGGGKVNNWNPWINSNVIVVFAVFAKDRDLLIKGVEKTAKSTDNFIKSYNEDGACDEGPGYFGAAGAALFDYLEVLADITDGRASIYENELIRNMARYIYRVYIGGNYYVNFADGSCRPGASAKLMARTGKAIGDENLVSFANYITDVNPGRNRNGVGRSHIYRALKSLFQERYDAKPFEFPKVHWFEDTEILVARDTSAEKGMFIAAKGGNNDESHNHNDVGSFIVYFDGKPVIVDAGVETYTKKTFSSERYDIWTMQSCYHTLPTVNGCDQLNGEKYRSSEVRYSHSGDVTELSMQLKDAYPHNSGIESYTRLLKFEHGRGLSVRDSYKLSQCKVPFVFNAVCVNRPVVIEQGRIKLSEDVEMAFDYGALDLFVDEIELTDTRIRNDWQQVCLYRLRLSEKEMKEINEITVSIYTV